MKPHQWQKDHYLISTDKKKLDPPTIHRFLTTTYWATGRTLAEVKTSIENSICFGVYKESAQIGFARVVTDFATVAFLADVFILPPYQSQGLGRWLVECVLSIPEFQPNNFWLLLTKDAQWLYHRFGFKRFHTPDGVMVKTV